MTIPPHMARASGTSVHRLESIAPDIRVLQEHIAILREIQAPEELISVAVRVAEEAIAANQKR
jgi:hypothetical protein